MVISEKEQTLINIFIRGIPLSSSEAHAELIKIGKKTSLVTVKRTLSEMLRNDLLIASGSGPSTVYDISVRGRLFAEIDTKTYCSIEPDARHGKRAYNFDLLSNLPADIFSKEELDFLENATDVYKERIIDLPPAIQRKEWERLVIELSWKSSRIEGNTYTLLDTEKLILENKEAPGHDKKEAQMILNHKFAFSYIHDNPERFKTITRKNLEELHAIIVKGLSIGLGFRQRSVGVTGSVYRPLDNIYQISEAVDDLEAAVSKASTPYVKALIAILGISYIQPFEDGNKRTARLMANAMLLSHGCAPLSYRSVDEDQYKESTLVFYELNSIVPFKKILIEQYDFAARNYAVK